MAIAVLPTAVGPAIIMTVLLVEIADMSYLIPLLHHHQPRLPRFLLQPGLHHHRSPLFLQILLYPGAGHTSLLHRQIFHRVILLYHTGWVQYLLSSLHWDR